MGMLLIGQLCWRFKIGLGTHYVRTLFDVPREARDGAMLVRVTKTEPYKPLGYQEIMTYAEYQEVRQ
jgi:hypothetical protein